MDDEVDKIDIITNEMKNRVNTLNNRISIIKPKGYRLIEYVDNAGNQTFSLHCYKIDTHEMVREAW